MKPAGHAGDGRLGDLFRRLGDAQDRALEEVAHAGDAGGARGRGVARSGVRARGAWRARAVGVALAGAVVAAAVALAFVVRPAAGWRASPVAVAPATGTNDQTQARPAPGTLSAGDSELPLRFRDGSTATFGPGSTGRVLAQTGAGAEVELLGGRVEVNVVHAAGARWLFRAGPFAVHVTGTRFSIDWAPSRRELAVSLLEGSVTVDGAVLGAGVPLRAGQRLRVALDRQLVTTEGLHPGPGVVADREGADRGSDRALDRAAESGRADWMSLAARGAHAEAWRTANRLGIAQLRRRLSAPGLLALADVARYSGAHAEARAIFNALVTRFPRHRLTGDAVFSLGRLAFEAGDPASAARWFARYRDTWPGGALAPEALGRLLESTAAHGDLASAAPIARAYLDRSPEGPYAALARKILGR